MKRLLFIFCIIFLVGFTNEAFTYNAYNLSSMSTDELMQPYKYYYEMCPKKSDPISKIQWKEGEPTIDEKRLSDTILYKIVSCGFTANEKWNIIIRNVKYSVSVDKDDIAVKDGHFEMELWFCNEDDMTKFVNSLATQFPNAEQTEYTIKQENKVIVETTTDMIGELNIWKVKIKQN